MPGNASLPITFLVIGKTLPILLLRRNEQAAIVDISNTDVLRLTDIET